MHSSIRFLSYNSLCSIADGLMYEYIITQLVVAHLGLIDSRLYSVNTAYHILIDTASSLHVLYCIHIIQQPSGFERSHALRSPAHGGSGTSGVSSHEPVRSRLGSSMGTPSMQQVCTVNSKLYTMLVCVATVVAVSYISQQQYSIS
jgi:hypothetical protein